jgi:hypothetical protein
MTLLRRAPREVYRVYDEEEFLARTDCEVAFEAVAASGERRMKRVLGATTLVAITGVVGGLAVFTSPRVAAGGSRRSRGLLAAASALANVRTARSQMWRAPVKTPVVVRRSNPVEAKRLPPGRLATRGQPARRGERMEATPSPTGLPAVLSPQARPAPRPQAAGRSATWRLAAEQPAAEHPAAGQPAAGQPAAGQPEFGFER